MASHSEPSFPPASLRPILAEVAELLANAQNPEDPSAPVTVAIAETTTGGILSAALLSVSGASKWYAGGASLYTLKSRVAWGGWGEKEIQSYRGPTAEVVAGLAINVCNTLEATYCLSESGAAGPTVPGPPYCSVLGETVIAVGTKSGKVTTRIVQTGLGGDRERNMVAFAEHALILLRDVLKGTAELRELPTEKAAPSSL